jgi:hypothetical protein
VAEKLVLSSVGQPNRERRYRIEVSERQLDVLIAASELLGRVGAGQLFGIPQHLPTLPSPAAEAEALDGLRQAERQLVHVNCDERCTPESRVSWDIYQVLRYQRAWDRSPEGGTTVDFSEPLLRSRERAITIEGIEK